MGACAMGHVLPAFPGPDLHTSHMPKSPPQAPAPAVRRRRLRDWTPLLLARATHPRQALVTAVVLAGAAALDGRPAREIALVGGTVLVGQVILGWHNDLVDEQADLAHDRTGKPIADVAATYFAAGSFFQLDRIAGAARGIHVTDYFDRLALDRALDTIGQAERRLAAEMVGNGAVGPAAVDAWVKPRAGEVERIRTAVHGIASSGLTLSKLSVAASLLGDLVKQ